MLTALLPNGKVIHANQYDGLEHGYNLFCIDPKCKSPVIYVSKGNNRAAYFKTIGKEESTKHSMECGFYEPLDIVGSIEKTTEYQEKLLNDTSFRQNLKFIRLNMNSLDPDHVATPKEPREPKEKDESKLGLRDKKDQPDSISSMSSIIKLLTTNEPDVLSTIYFNISGQRFPLSHIILSPKRAYELLWSDQALRLKYFVYGRIINVAKREKVTYLNIDSESSDPFTIVIFNQYLSNFSSIPDFEALIGKDVIVYGQLKKNNYDNRSKCEIVVTTEKYLATFKRKQETD